MRSHFLIALNLINCKSFLITDMNISCTLYFLCAQELLPHDILPDEFLRAIKHIDYRSVRFLSFFSFNIYFILYVYIYIYIYLDDIISLISEITKEGEREIPNPKELQQTFPIGQNRGNYKRRKKNSVYTKKKQ